MRHEDDIIRQLSSIGSKTYMSSHKSPYGDTAKVKTLNEAEFQGLWSRLRKENLDLIEHPEANVDFKARKTTSFADTEREDRKSPRQETKVERRSLQPRKFLSMHAPPARS